MSEKKIARTLKEAQVGDYVYIRTTQWERRKAPWYLVQVTAINTQSLTCSIDGFPCRFSRSTGEKRKNDGWSAGHKAYAADGFEERRWSDSRRKISELVGAADIDTLRQIAAIIGFKLPPVEVEGAE